MMINRERDNKSNKKNNGDIKKGRKGGIIIVLLAVAVAGITALAACVYQRKIQLADRMAENYSVRGVDVSYYQGEIEWPVLADSISFVYMKATEGSGHMDIRFEENLEGALGTDLAVGAYHFFSFESSGRTQAENYIAVVGRWDGMLAPAVDVEYYSGSYDITDVEGIRNELQSMLDELEAYYGCKPVIYTTMSAYSALIQGEFTEYPLWIRNVYFQPIALGKNWVFWQYNDRGILEGYSGEEKYIDLDVFSGNTDALENYRIYDNKEDK